jgi:IS30 family transposase
MPYRKGLDPERIKTEHAAGASASEIAKKLGASVSTIHYHLKKDGLRSNGARRQAGRQAGIFVSQATAAIEWLVEAHRGGG